MSSIVMKSWFARPGQTYRVATSTGSIYGYALCEFVGKRPRPAYGMWTVPVQSRWKIIRQMTDSKIVKEPGCVDWMVCRRRTRIKAVPARKARQAIERHDQGIVQWDSA